MTDDITPDAPETPQQAEGATPDEPLNEGGLSALRSERAARAAAEKNFKEATARLKEYEDRDKSELQRALEAAEAAKAEASTLRAANVRAEVAAAKGVPATLLTGSTQEELEASADALLEFRGEKATPPLYLPGEGKTPDPKPVSAEQTFLRGLLGNQ